MQSAFTNAAARWERVIVRDLPDADTTDIRGHSACDPHIPLIIDDIFICATIKYIDGPGGILGNAAAEYLRDDTSLPVTGYMVFDTDDVNQMVQDGSFDKAILHEIGHLYGLSSFFWQRTGLSSIPSSTTTTCRYKSASIASKEWQTLTGCSNAIPLEQGGGIETACTHWDETCLQGELMTGYLNGHMQMSRMTVGSLQDMGYAVDYNGADAFGFYQVNSNCVSTGPGRRLLLQQEQKGHDDDDERHNSTKNVAHNQQTDLLMTTDEARFNAIAHGKHILKKNAAGAFRTRTYNSQSNYAYAADQLVSVLYRDLDGSVQSRGGQLLEFREKDECLCDFMASVVDEHR